jgi:hypothetical protein
MAVWRATRSAETVAGKENAITGTKRDLKNHEREDPPLAALAVTPGGEVWDYRVIPDVDGHVATTAVRELPYERIGCRNHRRVRLTPEISIWLDGEGAMKPKLRVNQPTS